MAFVGFFGWGCFEEGCVFGVLLCCCDCVYMCLCGCVIITIMFIVDFKLFLFC